MKQCRIALITAILLPLLPSACSTAMRSPAPDAAATPGADSSVPDTWLQPVDLQPDLSQESSIPSDAAMETAALGLDRESAQFLAYAGDLSGQQIFTVTYRGNAPSGQLQVAVSGPGAPGFKVSGDTCSSAVLAMGATCAVSLVFAPSASQVTQASARLTITDSATGESVSAALEGRLCDLGDRLILSVGPDLGTVNPGAQGAEGLVAVTNSGPALCGALGPITPSVSNPSIAISSNTCADRQLLKAGETCVIGLRLAPPIGTAPATVAAVLTVTTAHDAVSTTVVGKIVSEILPTASPRSINFGSVPVNQLSAVQTVTVSNYGSTPSEPLSVTLAGTGVAQVSIVGNTCKGSIPPASTCTVSVQYLPADTTGVTGTITITDGSASIMIPMVGAGVAAPTIDAGCNAGCDAGWDASGG